MKSFANIYQRKTQIVLRPAVVAEEVAVEELLLVALLSLVLVS